MAEKDCNLVHKMRENSRIVWGYKLIHIYVLIDIKHVYALVKGIIFIVFYLSWTMILDYVVEIVIK